MVKVEFRDGSAPPNTKVTTHIWIVTLEPAVRRTARGGRFSCAGQSGFLRSLPLGFTGLSTAFSMRRGRSTCGVVMAGEPRVGLRDRLLVGSWKNAGQRCVSGPARICFIAAEISTTFFASNTPIGGLTEGASPPTCEKGLSAASGHRCGWVSEVGGKLAQPDVDGFGAPHLGVVVLLGADVDGCGGQRDGDLDHRRSARPGGQ